LLELQCMLHIARNDHEDRHGKFIGGTPGQRFALTKYLRWEVRMDDAVARVTNLLPNVKEHTASTEDTQNNHTDGGGLDVSPCSASSFWQSTWELICAFFQMRERYVWRNEKWNHELYLPNVANSKDE